MNQKDPNNISGLLKMHLRGKNLLCDESITAINRVLTQDMVRHLTPHQLCLVVTDLVIIISLL